MALGTRGGREVLMSANPAGSTAESGFSGSSGSSGGAEPQIPPPPWQRLPDRQARRRREPISRDAIVAAAIRLLDREGLAALSMRRLADELGAGAASLYWHVGSKDGLLDLVLDEIIGEGQVPDPDPARWREQLKDVARAQRRASLRHPYLVRISIGRIPMGPNALRYYRTGAGDLAGRPVVAAPGRAGLPTAHRHGERLHRGRDRGGGRGQAQALRTGIRPASRRPGTWSAITSSHSRATCSRR